MFLYGAQSSILSEENRKNRYHCHVRKWKNDNNEVGVYAVLTNVVNLFINLPIDFTIYLLL